MAHATRFSQINIWPGLRTKRNAAVTLQQSFCSLHEEVLDAVRTELLSWYLEQ